MPKEMLIWYKETLKSEKGYKSRPNDRFGFNNWRLLSQSKSPSLEITPIASLRIHHPSTCNKYKVYLGQNIFSTAIFQVFILMERLEKTKNKYAPQLYKTLVFLFLEEYDNELKREIILEGFEKFFNNNQDIPIDILLEPYLNQLNSCQNYALCDFLFFFKILEHPRIENKDVMAIIQFILNVCLNNVIYSRTANLILSLIFEKNIIESKCTNAYDINEIEYKFVDFINTALDSYITNISKEEDKFILETPYDIMTENFTNENAGAHEYYKEVLAAYNSLNK